MPDESDDMGDDERDGALDHVRDDVPTPADDDSSQMIANARRRHGTFGAALAAGMLGLDKVLGRKPREDAPIVVASPTEPTDIDTDGIVVPLDGDLQVVAPAQPPKDPYARRRARRPGRH